jgi:hypothetical protein
MPEMLKRKLERICKQRGYTKERCARYVYGTLRKTGYTPKRK